MNRPSPAEGTADAAPQDLLLPAFLMMTVSVYPTFFGCAMEEAATV